LATVNNAAATVPDREIVLTRDFNAPRELVFDACTRPDYLQQWYGPHGFTMTITESDVRPAGFLRFTLHDPNGANYSGKVVYIEVDSPERLVYDHSDEGGDELTFRVTTSFSEDGDKTRIEIRMRFQTVEARDAAISSGSVEMGYQTLDRLAEVLAGNLE